MKNISIIMTLTILLGLHVQAENMIREITDIQCLDSEGDTIADAGFNYTKVMNNELLTFIGFYKTVEKCDQIDFAPYEINNNSKIDGEDVTQITSKGSQLVTQNCRNETLQSDKSIFQSAQIFRNKIILTTSNCAELTLNLKPLSNSKR